MKFKVFIRNKLYIILKYPLVYLKLRKKFDNNPIKYYDDVKTVDLIVKKKKSLARFGDGEFNLIYDDKFDIGFQKHNDKLGKRLNEVLDSNNDDLLIGIPSFLNIRNTLKLTSSAKKFWSNFLLRDYDKIIELINTKKTYSDTQITRCYMDYKNKKNVKDKYDNLKRIWNKKDIVIIEGSGTKMGIGNDLYNNAKSIKRIVCPANNAFDKYDEIFSYAKKYCKNKLTLVALGPTATVLVNDLANLNGKNIIYQAIDLGHLDIEYEWFKNKAKKKIAIKGKNVNEIKDSEHNDFKELLPKEYLDQIIVTIK